jgi:Zn-dependent peptidase ImmA (M78 family)/transcriptional regulator with XRE-family HTH domain
MLTLAKESAGLTQAAIAQHAGISQSLMSKIENGFETPSDDFIAKTAAITGVPVDLFYQSDAVLTETLFDIFHKKRLTLPQKPLRKANSNARIIRLEIGRLLRSFDIPAPLPFPNLPIDEHESAAEVAALTRAMWRMPAGPLPDLVGAVEATGTPVIVTDLEHEKLRALSMPGVKSDNSHIVVLNSRLPASAQRFALAHEIGHLVMHDGVASQEMEKEADDFASALLMPASDISPQLRNVRFRDLGELKRYWRVSLAALIYRSYSLGLITERHYRTLNMNLNNLPNGRKREPGEFAAEQPALIKRVIRSYKDDLGYSLDELCKLLVVTSEKFTKYYCDEPITEQVPSLRLIQNS